MYCFSIRNFQDRTFYDYFPVSISCSYQTSIAKLSLPGKAYQAMIIASKL